jgi:hypothetical protein
MPPNTVVCRGGVAISAREVYAHGIHVYAMDAHEMQTREMQPRRIYTYGMHAREIYTRKYMLMGCTSEITALIFPKVYLKLVLYCER